LSGAYRIVYVAKFDALEETPVEAQNMKLRSALMMQLQDSLSWLQVR
jgi:predicted XRE-type DNA-binding protein